MHRNAEEWYSGGQGYKRHRVIAIRGLPIDDRILVTLGLLPATRRQGLRKTVDLIGLSAVRRISEGFSIRKLDLKFELKGFKKARFDDFDASVLLYQEPLTKEEISEISQKLARFFVETIKKRTGSHP